MPLSPSKLPVVSSGGVAEVLLCSILKGLVWSALQPARNASFLGARDVVMVTCPYRESLCSKF